MTWNSALPFLGAKDKALAESIGTPQFQGTDSFFLVQNGLIYQGGFLDTLAVGSHQIPFEAPLFQQILSIQLTEIDGTGIARVDSATTTLEMLGLTVAVAPTKLYWWVVGV